MTEPENQAGALPYGLKLIAEAIQEHFGERVEDYDEDFDDTANHDAWEAFDLLTRASLPEAPAVPVGVPQLGGAPDDLHNLIKVVFADMTIERMNEVCREVIARRSALQSSPPVKAAAVDEEEEIEIDRLRLAAFKTNSNEDKAAYYLTVSKWFQDRHSRALTSQNAVEGEAVAWQIGNDGALYPTKEAADKHIAGWALKGQVCGPARPLYARPAPPVSPTRTMADVLGDQKIGVTLQNRPVIG